jgi:hypothetical protein
MSYMLIQYQVWRRYSDRQYIPLDKLIINLELDIYRSQPSQSYNMRRWLHLGNNQHDMHQHHMKFPECQL